MQAAPIPTDETQRLAALKRYQILDSLPESVYDDIVALASHICHTPMAMISLVDTDRQWFKARVGLAQAQTSRRDSFCAHAIIQPAELFEVQDAHDDPRFFDNPLVTGAPHVRFYAGAPIVTPEGMALGALCVLDTKQRGLDGEQRELLMGLARQVTALLELRERTEQSESLSAELKRLSIDAEERRRESAKLLELVLLSGNFGFWDLDVTTNRWTVNEREREMLGLSEQDASPDKLDWWSRIHPDDKKLVERAAAHHRGKLQTAYEYHHRMRQSDGSWIWVLDRSVVVTRDADGAPLRIIGTHQDVTQRRQMADELARTTSLLRRTNELAKVGGWELDVASQQLLWSDEVYRIHEVSPLRDPLLEDGLRFYPPDARPVIADAVRLGMSKGKSWDLELPFVTAKGRHLWVRTQGMAEQQSGITVRLTGAFQDITERKNIEIELLRTNAKLSELSQTDALTGISNRRSFDTTLEIEWMRHLRTRAPLSILLIDVDYFKAFNDYYGHVSGDACLRLIARLLATNVQRAGELLARYGGEEFIILLPNTDEAHALLTAQSCLQAIANEHIAHLGLSNEGEVSLSVGVASAVPSAAHLSNKLVNAADQALYRAKSSGRARVAA